MQYQWLHLVPSYSSYLPGAEGAMRPEVCDWYLLFRFQLKLAWFLVILIYIKFISWFAFKILHFVMSNLLTYLPGAEGPIRTELQQTRWTFVTRSYCSNLHSE